MEGVGKMIKLNFRHCDSLPTTHLFYIIEAGEAGEDVVQVVGGRGEGGGEGGGGPGEAIPGGG